MAFENEKDEFWDLSRIVPKKRPLSKFATESPVRDYEIPGEGANSPSSERAITFSGEREVEIDVSDESYIHSGSTFIKRVTVRKKKDKYDFYDSFRKSAILYFDVEADPCDFVQFYSYMPQYSQLKDTQKSYYFYWRREMRRGRYIKTDYSYLYLAVYEIINLPDLIPPEEGIRILTSLWREYRSSLPRIDFYFSIWVQDYCLIHRLPSPTEAISDFLFDILPSSPLKEFYLTDISSSGERGLLTMLAFLSTYDYRKGKFVSGNPDAPEEKRKRQESLYRAHINGSLLELFRKHVASHIEINGEDNVKKIVRDAFPNSLATHTVKSSLEIEYYSLTDNPALSEKITAAVRYAENRLRALIGVKSRLSVKGLPDDYKRTLDGYFDALDARERAIRAKENVPVYEKLYAAPKEKLSVESADKIESISWITTARLVEYGDTREYDVDEAVANKDDAPKDGGIADIPSPSDDALSIGLSRGDVLFIAYLSGYGTPDQSDIPRGIEKENAKDRINEAFFNSFGDVLIEECDGEYKIIDDYMEDAKEWLSKIMG